MFLKTMYMLCQFPLYQTTTENISHLFESTCVNALEVIKVRNEL